MHPVHTHPLQMQPQQLQPHQLETHETLTSTVLESIDQIEQQPQQQLQVLGALNEQQHHLHQLQPIQASVQANASLEQVTNQLAASSSCEHDQALQHQQQQHQHHQQSNLAQQPQPATNTRPLQQRPQIEGIVAEGGGPIVQWLLDNYEIADGESLPRSTVYNHYLAHCKDLRMASVNAASFGKLIRSVFIGLKTRRLGTRGHSKYHYFGVRAKQHIQQELLQHQEGVSRNNNNDENSNQNTDFGSESDSTGAGCGGGSGNQIECKRVKRTEHSTLVPTPAHPTNQQRPQNSVNNHHQLYTQSNELVPTDGPHKQQNQQLELISSENSNNRAAFYQNSTPSSQNGVRNSDGYKNKLVAGNEHDLIEQHQLTHCQLAEMRNYLGANWSTLVDEHWPQRDPTSISNGQMMESSGGTSEFVDTLDLFESFYKSYYKRMIELLSELKFSQVEQLWLEFWNPINMSHDHTDRLAPLPPPPPPPHQEVETIHHHHQNHHHQHHHQQQQQQLMLHQHQDHLHLHHHQAQHLQQHHQQIHHQHQQIQQQHQSLEHEHWASHVEQNGQPTSDLGVEAQQQQQQHPLEYHQHQHQHQHPNPHPHLHHQQQQHQIHLAPAPLSFYYLYQLTSQPAVVERINQIDYSLYHAIELFLFPDVLSPIPPMLVQKIDLFSINFGAWMKTAVKDFEPHFVKEKYKSAQTFGNAMRQYSRLNQLSTASRKIWNKRDLLSQMSIDLSRVDLCDIEHQVSLMSPITRENHQALTINNKTSSANLLNIPTSNGASKLNNNNNGNNNNNNNNGNNEEEILNNKNEINNELENNENSKYMSHHNQSHYNHNNMNNTDNSISTNTNNNYHQHHSCGTMPPAQLIQNLLHLLEDPCPANSWPDWCRNLVESRVCGHSLEEATSFYLKWHFYISLIMRELTLKSSPSFASFQLIRLLFDEYIFYLSVTRHKTP